MENLTYFRKMVETGMDLHLQWCYRLNKTSLAERLRDTTFSPLHSFIAGLPRARSVRGTEPHTHGIWSTSFRLVVT